MTWEGGETVCCDLLLVAQTVRGVAPSDPSFHLELEPKPVAAREARRFVAEHVGDAADNGTLALLTSELVANGVLHARTHLHLGITAGDDHVLVTCADDDTSGTPAVPAPDHGRPSGRGLMLVNAMASEWGVLRSEGGKTVWFTVPRRGAEVPGEVET